MPEKKTSPKEAKANRAAGKASPQRAPAEPASAGKLTGETAVLAKIAAMPEPFRGEGERLHAAILRAAPTLQPKLWYGMPAYAQDGVTVCFFRSDKKYMTFGFTQEADLTREEGAPHQLMGAAWFFTALDDATEAKLSAIVRKVAGY